MDKNKLAEEYGHNNNDSNHVEFYAAKNGYLAGFDAAESIANAKIQELEDFRQAQVEEIKRCDSNLKILNNKITELEKEQVLHIELLAQEYEKSYKSKITELEQQLKDHRESLRKSVNRSADLSEQLKKAESVIEFYGDKKNWRYMSNSSVGAFDAWLDFKPDHFCKETHELGGYHARQYLKLRGE